VNPAHRISANCPSCGRIEVGADEIRLTVFVNRPELSHYDFHCDFCNDDISKPVTEPIVSILVAANVSSLFIEIPAEALEPHTGPAICWDDILDFESSTPDLSELAA
jgi:hypothetical protein